MTTAQREDVVDLLLAQHTQIKELFATVLAAPVSGREEPFKDLVRLLAVHETAEEELVHPLARETIEAGDNVVRERLGEEQRAKQALVDLYDLGVEHEDFQRRLRDLRDVVVDHASHEEREEFPKLRESVPRERRERLAKAVLAAEAMAPTRPHPSVRSAKANLLLGPPLAIFDRARDMMRDLAKRENE